MSALIGSVLAVALYVIWTAFRPRAPRMDWREGILMLHHPTAATLTAFLAGMDAEPADGPAFAWFDEE